jgi:HK97 family phage prohead protease
MSIMERRFRHARPELRMVDGKPPMIVSHVAVFNSRSPQYWGLTEEIASGFFDDVVGADADVPALFNHDDNFAIGSTTSTPPTLRMIADNDGSQTGLAGLYTETDPPDTATIRDLVLTPMRMGIIKGASFGFSLPMRGDKGFPGDRVVENPDGSLHRTLLRAATLEDVTPACTRPFYPQAPTALRALAAARAALARRGAEPGDVRVLADEAVAAILADPEARYLSPKEVLLVVAAIGLLEELVPDDEPDDEPADQPTPSPAAGPSVLAGQQPTGAAGGQTLYSLFARKPKVLRALTMANRPPGAPVVPVTPAATPPEVLVPELPVILPALASLKVRLAAAERSVL